MTTISASSGATFAQSIEGPTPGQPRVASSVNDPPLKTALNNDLALADGYRRSVSVNISTSEQTTVVTGMSAHLIAASTGDVWPQTLQFPAVSTGAWKEIYADRLSRTTVLTFQSGGPYSTFYQFVSPGEIGDVRLVFRNTTGTTWSPVSACYMHGGVYDIITSAPIGASVAQRGMREIWLRRSDGHTLNDGTYDIDLDAEKYFPGDRVSVYVRGASPGVLIQVRDDSDNVIHSSSDDRTYGSYRLDVMYTHSGTWIVMGVFTSDHPTIVAGTKFASLTATTQTLTLKRRYYTVPNVTSNITITVPSGTWIGQEISIAFRNIQSGNQAIVSFNGGDLKFFTGGPYQAWNGAWDGTEWHVT